MHTILYNLNDLLWVRSFQIFALVEIDATNMPNIFYNSINFYSSLNEFSSIICYNADKYT